MSFIFDFIMDQLTYYNQLYSQTIKGQTMLKRKYKDNNLRQYLDFKLYIFILGVLNKCFTYDKEDFIDTNKFERLINPLIDQFDNIKIGDNVNLIHNNYENFLNEKLIPCVLQLFELIKDDYKWKSLSYAILLKTRNENVRVKLGVLKMIMRMVEQLKARIVILISDILPFLSETLEDENIEVYTLFYYDQIIIL